MPAFVKVAVAVSAMLALVGAIDRPRIVGLELAAASLAVAAAFGQLLDNRERDRIAREKRDGQHDDDTHEAVVAEQPQPPRQD